jgi:peptide/nickel transport system permease protein
VSASNRLMGVALRVGQAFLTLCLVIVLVFILVRLIPGDPVATILGTDASPAAEAALRAQLHLDMPMWEQFKIFAGNLLRGDLGVSAVQRGTSVGEIIVQATPVTLAVALTGMALGVLFGTPLGLAAAISRHPVVDVVVRVWAMFFYATPTFLTALVFILIFAINLNWLPAGGWPGSYPANVSYLVLPGLALSGHLAPAVARTVRQAAKDILGQSFIEAGISRGLPVWRLNLFHILPNALLPVITLLGVNFGSLLTGAIIVEAVFGIPGLGTQMVHAVTSRDYTVIEGISIVSACAVLLGNLVADFAGTVLDPRART